MLSLKTVFGKKSVLWTSGGKRTKVSALVNFALSALQWSDFQNSMSKLSVRGLSYLGMPFSTPLGLTHTLSRPTHLAVWRGG